MTGPCSSEIEFEDAVYCKYPALMAHFKPREVHLPFEIKGSLALGPIACHIGVSTGLYYSSLTIAM